MFDPDSDPISKVHKDPIKSGGVTYRANIYPGVKTLSVSSLSIIGSICIPIFRACSTKVRSNNINSVIYLHIRYYGGFSYNIDGFGTVVHAASLFGIESSKWVLVGFSEFLWKLYNISFCLTVQMRILTKFSNP